MIRRNVSLTSILLCASLVVATLLTACGDDDDTSTPTPTEETTAPAA